MPANSRSLRASGPLWPARSSITRAMLETETPARPNGRYRKVSALLGGARVERQGVQLGPHAALQGGVDHLMALHPRQALEDGGDDARPVVVAVSGEILHHDRGVRERRVQMRFELVLSHGHVDLPPRWKQKPEARLTKCARGG